MPSQQPGQLNREANSKRRVIYNDESVGALTRTRQGFMQIVYASPAVDDIAMLAMIGLEIVRPVFALMDKVNDRKDFRRTQREWTEVNDRAKQRVAELRTQFHESREKFLVENDPKRAERQKRLEERSEELTALPPAKTNYETLVPHVMREGARVSSVAKNSGREVLEDGLAPLVKIVDKDTRRALLSGIQFVNNDEALRRIGDLASTGLKSSQLSINEYGELEMKPLAVASMAGIRAIIAEENSRGVFPVRQNSRIASGTRTALELADSAARDVSPRAIQQEFNDAMANVSLPTPATDFAR